MAKLYSKLGMITDLYCLFEKLKISKNSSCMTPSESLENEHFAFQRATPYSILKVAIDLSDI